MNPLQIDNASELRLFLQEEIYVLPEDLNGAEAGLETGTLTVAEVDLDSGTLTGVKVDSDAGSGVNTMDAAVETSSSSVDALPLLANKEIKFLGGNGQRILILLKDTLDKELHAEERKLLMAILDAIKIKVPDYALVFWDAHQNYSFADFTQHLNSQKVLSFGMQSVDLGLQNLPFNHIHQDQGVSFILTQHLTELKNDVQAKRSFWTTLKVLFP